ncbi:hypothetical protein M0R45_005590 [Rubus argutus]|uniref:Uncharacterized protein n=1 Tax=Rubus argutus TaxID=59490 RepID=A0AAW1YN23_RUBAR
MDLEVKSDAGAGMLLCKQATSAFDLSPGGVGADQIDIEGDALNILNSLKLDVLYMDLSDIGGGIDEVRLVLPTFTMVSWKHVRKRDNRSSRPWTAGSALPLVQSMYVL